MGFRVAVAGATGSVGREVLKTLAERAFPVEEAVALASGRAVGQQVSFGEDAVLKVGSLERFDFAGTDLVFLAPGVPAAQGQRAAEAGCLVIDAAGGFRNDPEVPVVVPEVNGEVLGTLGARRIVASPVGGAIQLALVLKPMHDIARARRVVVATYQPVSGAGREGMDELFTQTRGVFVNDSHAPEQFTKPIAFNVIPHVDRFMDDGGTREEALIAADTRRLIDPELSVSVTCVRVPVFIGQAEAVHVAFEGPISVGDAREALRETPGVTLLDQREDGGYVTPVDVAGEDPVFVSRLRRDQGVPSGLAFWCAADNLRKGGALNAVQIAEELVRRGGLARKGG